MSAAPILILQMHRMGDLVLSFPLLAWLEAKFPGHPLWVMGEKTFFDPLMPLSPRVTYFSYSNKPQITGLMFAMVINLSSRPEAARLASMTKTDRLIGPYLDAEGALRIAGDWQLYRASLTHNNQYNLFHWADLNALDCISTQGMRWTKWPLPRTLPGGIAAPGVTPVAGFTGGSNGRIGLFLGASEPEKHPDAAFWIQLTKLLLQAGLRPVLLGGKAESALGTAVAQGLGGAHSLNLCGRFTVKELAHFISELDLLITPDTGPMHIATWTGTPTLNLSLGPVNAWETGPFSPGHHVLRAAVDCIGCWRCTQPQVSCKEQMVAGRVATVVENLLGSRHDSLESLVRRAKGLELLSTGRDTTTGLYSLRTLFSSPLPAIENFDKESHSVRLTAARQSISCFWQAWFGRAFARFTEEQCRTAWKELHAQHPEAAVLFQESGKEFYLLLAHLLKAGSAAIQETSEFWKQAHPVLRPFSGYIHMYLQNNSGDRAASLHVMGLVERLIADVE